MIRLSQLQLVKLWSELEQAYYGKNKFGGNVAEIYAYTVMENSPRYYLSNPSEYNTELELEAAQTIYEVLKLFSDYRDCIIYVEGRLLAKWVKTIKFSHRVHIQVKQKKGK